MPSGSDLIGEDGKPIILNHIFRTLADSEGAGDEGQLSIDMSPTQPHTMTENARTCESCHASAKALGLGIGSTRPWDERHYVELETVDGKILSGRAQPQMEAIEGLNHDWSQIVDESGNQLATVGHHFQLSRAFNKEEIARVKRDGICLACHQEIPSQSLAVSLLHHVAMYTGQLPDTTDQHNNLLHKVLLTSAWGQIVGLIAIVLIAATIWRWRRRQNGGDEAKLLRDGESRNSGGERQVN